MPFYSIIIVLTNGELHRGVRENANTFIDRVWEEYHSLAFKSYGNNMLSFTCVQISRNSKEYRDYKAGIKKIEPPIDPEKKEPPAFKQGKGYSSGKYRDNRAPTTDTGWGEMKMKEITKRNKNGA